MKLRNVGAVSQTALIFRPVWETGPTILGTGIQNYGIEPRGNIRVRK